MAAKRQPPRPEPAAKPAESHGGPVADLEARIARSEARIAHLEDRVGRMAAALIRMQGPRARRVAVSDDSGEE